MRCYAKTAACDPKRDENKERGGVSPNKHWMHGRAVVTALSLGSFYSRRHKRHALAVVQLT